MVKANESTWWTVLFEELEERPQADIWLEPSLLGWPASISGSITHPSELAMRAYEHHQHAEDRLQSAVSIFDRVDVVTTLKRAVDNRLRHLQQIYDLCAIPIRDKPSWTLDILAHFGAARTLMVNELRDIRNAVEHEDAAPPSTQELYRFLDLVWYFLKSTDQLAVSAGVSLHFEEPSDGGIRRAFEIDVEPKTWRMAVSAWVGAQQVSAIPLPGWITLGGVIEKGAHEGDGPGAEQGGRRVRAIGTIRGPRSAIERVVRLLLGGSIE
jgi:hypothetical protein